MDLFRLLVVQLRHYLTIDGPGNCSLTIGIVSHRSHAAQSFSKCQQDEALLPQGKGQKCVQKGAGSGRPWSKRPVDLLSEQEFREHFHIPNDISILLVDDEPTPTEKLSHNATYFNKDQLNVGLCFPLPSLLKQFFHFTKISPTFLHPNAVRVLMGCNILDMLYHLDLFLLELLFVYTIKMS